MVRIHARWKNPAPGVEGPVEMQALSATPEVAAELRRTIGEIDVRHCLDRIGCRALVLHCSGDQVQSPEQSRRIARTLPDAEFHLWDPPNHVLVPSDPIWAECLDVFDRFLAEGLEAENGGAGDPAR